MKCSRRSPVTCNYTADLKPPRGQSAKMHGRADLLGGHPLDLHQGEDARVLVWEQKAGSASTRRPSGYRVEKVCFVSLADIASADPRVRFTPKADNAHSRCQCLQSARSGRFGRLPRLQTSPTRTRLSYLPGGDCLSSCGRPGSKEAQLGALEVQMVICGLPSSGSSSVPARTPM